MRTRLYNEPDYSLTAEQQILLNRGIPLDIQDRWLAGSKDEQFSWKELDYDKMVTAVSKVHDVVDSGKKLALVVDCDVDGLDASSLFVNYLYYRVPEYRNIHLLLHYGKQHGLADLMDRIPDDVDLVVSPDGASNDVEQHEELAGKGIDCVILDHHQVDRDISASPATIVNVQTCDYPDKYLTGSGVVWKFCQAYEEIVYGTQDRLDQFSDLAIVGGVGDMALYTDLEIRSMAKNGLAELHNDLLKAMAEAHSYVIEKRNGLNYLSVAWGICPFLNSVCRSGTMDEKEFVFKAMCDRWANEEVPNTKRGHRGETCRWCEEAVTVADRVKRRQTDLERAEADVCEEKIERDNLLDNGVLLLQLEPDEGEASINGLAGNAIQAKYQKPTIVTIRHETDQGVFWQGSMRNYSMSPIQDFKQVINDTGLAVAQGHPGASGVTIKDEDVPAFMARMNEVYKDVDQTPVYWIDYDWTPGTADYERILDIGGLDIYGQGVPESMVGIHSIDLSSVNKRLLGKTKNTIKLELRNGVSIMFFGVNDVLYDKMCEDGKCIDVVGTCNRNSWNGSVTPQVIVKDFDIYDDFIF